MNEIIFLENFHTVLDVFSTFNIFLEDFFWRNIKIPTNANETNNALTKEATMTITIFLFSFPPPFFITEALHGRKPWISPHRSLLLLKASNVDD